MEEYGYNYSQGWLMENHSRQQKGSTTIKAHADGLVDDRLVKRMGPGKISDVIKVGDTTNSMGVPAVMLGSN